MLEEWMKDPTKWASGEVLVLDREHARVPELHEKLAEAPAAPGKAYLRFGKVPEGGVSGQRLGGFPVPPAYAWYAEAAGISPETGLSAFDGRLTVEGNYLVKASSARLRVGLLLLAGVHYRPAYFVRGETHGRGSDGEPLIEEIESVEPVPRGCIVASEIASRGMELWNLHNNHETVWEGLQRVLETRAEKRGDQRGKEGAS